MIRSRREVNVTVKRPITAASNAYCVFTDLEVLAVMELASE